METSLPVRAPDAHQRRHETRLAAMAMLVVALLLAVIEYVRLDERQLRDLRTQADLIARTTTAAVVFDNGPDARDILSAFDGSPEVHGARLVFANGQELAR